MEIIEEKGWDFRLLFEYRKCERGREREVERWRGRGSGTVVCVCVCVRERERACEYVFGGGCRHLAEILLG